MQIAIPAVLVDGSSPVAVVPTSQTLALQQGVDVTLALALVNSAGAVVNITNYLAGTLVIRTAPANGPSAAAIVTTLQWTITNGASGLASFTLPGTTTKGLNSTYVWDVFTKNASGLRDQVVLESFVYFTPAAGA